MPGGGSQQTVQKADPWEGVQPFLTAANQRASALGSNPMPMYPGAMFAPRNPLQVGADVGSLDYVMNRFNPGMSTYQGLLSGMMTSPDRVMQNPAVAGMLDANKRESADFLVNNALPAVRGDFNLAGQYGSSKMGLAQGKAIGEVNKNLLNANADTMFRGWEGLLGQQKLASTLMPSALQAGNWGNEIAAQIGQTQQDQFQRGISEAAQRYYYPEQKLWDTLGKESGVYQGMSPFGTTTTTGTESGSPVAGVLGGGLAGYGMAQGLGLTAANAAPGAMTALGLGPAGIGVMGAMALLGMMGS